MHFATGSAAAQKKSSTARFAELLAARLPDGVLQILDGDGAVGARLADADRVDVVAHVGSSVTGRAIARSCAERGAKALLENGGNDALIVDGDVDPVWAAGPELLDEMTTMKVVHWSAPSD